MHTLAALILLAGHPGPTPTIVGTASYAEGIALPPTAVLDVRLEDACHPDSPGGLIAQKTIPATGSPPIHFELPYDAARIDRKHRYAVRAGILDGRLPMFVTYDSYPVLTEGHGNTVTMTLTRLTTAATPMPTPVLGGTSWKLTAIINGDGSQEAVADPSKYTIAFNADGSVSVRVDCNRGHGTWISSELGKVEIDPIATTRAMCPPGSIGDRVASDLTYFRSYAVIGDVLLLYPAADGGSYVLARGR